MKILVTGGTGYIGSHTVVELIQAGHDVVIADNLLNSRIEVLDRIEQITGKRPDFYQTELCNYSEVEDLFKQEPQIHAVIHFAAILLVDESVAEPLKYYHNNLFSQINLLKAMVAHGVKHIVFSSSCTVYGNPKTLPVSEMEPVKKAESTYGNTKQMGEEILEHTSKTKPIEALALRYFNPIGAHETALIGEVQHGPPHHLVPYITETALGKRTHLNVFGSDYPTPDGTCVRDYIHVVDVATAHIAALERLVKGQNKKKFEIFNIGTGVGYSVLDLIKAFEKVSGIAIPFILTARREGDAGAVYADTSLAAKELNWKAKYGIEEMLGSAWKWEQAGAGNIA